MECPVRKNGVDFVENPNFSPWAPRLKYIGLAPFPLASLWLPWNFGTGFRMHFLAGSAMPPKNMRVCLELQSGFDGNYSKIQQKTAFSAYFWNNVLKNYESLPGDGGAGLGAPAAAQEMSQGRRTRLLLEKNPNSLLMTQAEGNSTSVLGCFHGPPWGCRENLKLASERTLPRAARCHLKGR